MECNLFKIIEAPADAKASILVELEEMMLFEFAYKTADKLGDLSFRPFSQLNYGFSPNNKWRWRESNPRPVASTVLPIELRLFPQ
jgi:hypothetical protein